MVQQSADEGRNRRILTGGLIALAVALLVGFLVMKSGEDAAVTPAAKPVADTAPAAAKPETPAVAAPVEAATPADATPPSFDLARISADGTAVLAGRAPRDSQVNVIGNGADIGTAGAGAADGSWVVIVDKPLPEGSLELVLEAVLADGRVLRSRDILLVDVPKRGGGTGAIAVLTGQDDSGASTTRALQLPDSPPVDTPAKTPGLDVVEYGADGAPRLSGHAMPGATVRLYLDGKPAGEATAGPDGGWHATLEGGVAPGRYGLRIDVLGADGKVAERSEVPFERAPIAEASAAGTGSFTVQPGNSLWRIARGQLGSGTRYIDIYKANQGQIQDPNLIYPGQVLGLPRKK
ncbi:MAG: LysM peptidoglycan-binding domain-containing protein [Zavarzinia sp.]|nr:LysM peptidoglycan-binding domain-containing protein [Zavarzinia sp.]